ncbi:MAG TPA: hypothetical protein O0W79_05020 [Methanocorpusculum sp.]|nr:hypothetical protein [Methanocorpusculum sp.]
MLPKNLEIRYAQLRQYLQDFTETEPAIEDLQIPGMCRNTGFLPAIRRFSTRNHAAYLRGTQLSLKILSSEPDEYPP